ncbi:MAG TPA: O-methyltransferase [Sphingobacteriaceae bacterium]|nr:O-methyltransferase [Sphingobacteriaceae bacterium]
MELLSEELIDYLERNCEPEPELLKKVNRETHLKVLKPRMLSGHYQGRLLSMLSKLLSPKRILEVGTYTGYATLCLAEGLSPHGEIHTIDVNPELEQIIKHNVQQSDLYPKVKFHLGEALKIIPDLNEVWDLVFIDADKANNEAYYDIIINNVRSGGLILVDNVLWSGKVLNDIKDKDTNVIHQFNNKVANDPRVEKLILPVRDGIFVIRKN